MAGLTRLVLADVAADAQYHHSYFVVAHFHYALFGGIMGVMTRGLLLAAQMDRAPLQRALWASAFWLTVVSFNLTFIPQFFLGLAGMPRRIPDYALQFAEFNTHFTVGAFYPRFVASCFAYNIWTCVKVVPKAEGRVWEGAEGLEWELPSPPPHHIAGKPSRS